jgi:gas vesicle protein
MRRYEVSSNFVDRCHPFAPIEMQYGGAIGNGSTLFVSYEQSEVARKAAKEQQERAAEQMATAEAELADIQHQYDVNKEENAREMQEVLDSVAAAKRGVFLG